MSIVQKGINKILRTFPYVKSLQKEIRDLQKACGFPPRHYYSPIVDPKEYYHQQTKQSASEKYLPTEIDFNEAKQLALLKEFKTYYDEIPFGDSLKNGMRYYFDNVFFTYSDAISMYCMLRKYQPKRIIEIGSGFSSALILDTNEKFLSNSIDLTFIDPNPERLISILKPEEKVNLVKEKIQDVDFSLFEQLEEGDFLLIDTSHVSKSGSDVNHIYFNILPHIKKGVKIHIHDIFFPLEYPEQWVVEESRGWNEIFLVRSFLAFNNSFEMVFFNSFLEKRHKQYIQDNMPMMLKPASTVCGGIWIKRV